MTQKTIIAAFAAALFAAPAFAAEEYEAAAQVYDLTVSIKTTQAAKAKLSPKKNPFITDGTVQTVYRKQGTQKWTGVLWGCECEAVMGQWGLINGGSTVAGAAIWNTKKPYDVVLVGDIAWHVLNAFDTTGAKIEGAWTIGESTDTSAAFLSFAGFGTLSLNTEKDEDKNLTLENCGSYIKSISGNVSGWMPAPFVEVTGRAARCTFCGVVDEGTEDTYETAEAWNYCPCIELDGNAVTAVSGTWTLKYNAKNSKTLKQKTSITEVYKFPSSILPYINEKIAEVTGE